MPGSPSQGLYFHRRDEPFSRAFAVIFVQDALLSRSKIRWTLNVDVVMYIRCAQDRQKTKDEPQ